MTPTRSSEGAIPPEIATIDYVARWRDIVERRRVQMDAAYARAGIVHADYWGRRAKSFRAATHPTTEDDPFLHRVRAAAGEDSTVLDVGAGTGRHTLALAPHVRRVTAVDPSAAMLGLLREDVAAQRLENVTAVEAEWLRAEVEPADFVICSHVLYPIADVVPFIEKLQSAAKERLFVYLRADPIATDFGLWSEFHGMPLQGQPTHQDLFNLLVQIGIMADVEIVATSFTWSFDSLDEAVQQVAGGLCLADDDAAARAKLRDLIAARFHESEGRMMPNRGLSRSAIFSWAAA